MSTPLSLGAFVLCSAQTFKEELTVFFEEPFWVGVLEHVSCKKLSACKGAFGAEPKAYEIYDFVMKNYY